MSTARSFARVAAACLGAWGCSNTAVIASQPAIHADAATLDFGTATGGTQVSKTLTLTNQGTTTLSISSVDLSGDLRHAFSVGARPQQLTAGSSAVLQVTYAAPAAIGADAASLTISSDAGNAAMLVVSLLGKSRTACVAETDAAFCTRLGKNCGPVTAADDCGAQRTVASCGSCTLPAACGGLGVDNVCDVPVFPVAVTLAGPGGGTVVSSPAGINCGSTCTASFGAQSTVTLTAVPGGASSFAGFSGDCTGATCTLSITQARSVAATFTNQHALSVTVAGSGTVSSSPAGINACASGAGTCSAPFNDGVPITLTATPAGGAVFSGWSGGGCSGAGTCTITLAGAGASTTATFAAAHLITARAQHSAVLLQNGKVLVVGGVGPGGVPLKDAELYDPASGTWTPAGSVPHTLWFSSATLLNDGLTVFIAGGFTGNYTDESPDAWFWTEARGFVAATRLPVGRSSQSAVLLQSGKVLIVSGNTPNNLCSYATDAQLFDPAGNAGAGSWTATGSIHADRSQAGVALLTGGKVLLTGGPQDSCPTPNFGQSEAELYDPSTGLWTATGSMAASREFLDLIPLANGDALAAGGMSNNGALGSAETFHLGTTGAFSSTGSLTQPRFYDAAALLSDGRVAVVGGTTGSNYLTSVEVYDPSLRAWSPGAAQLNTGRYSHTATLLKNGKLLAVGGYGAPPAGQTSAVVLDSDEVLDESAGFAIGGTVSGLSGSGLVLADSLNGGAAEHLSVSSNGTFLFPSRATSGQTYSVSVITQPASPAQACTVTAGSGTATAAVTTVQVTCPPFVVASGLDSPTTLALAGSTLYFMRALPPAQANCYAPTGAGDAVMMVPANGSALPTKIDDLDNSAGNCGIQSIVFDATYVYWANYSDGVFKRATLAGTGLTTIFNGPTYTNALAIAGGNLFYHAYPNTSIARVSATGAGNTSFASTVSGNGQNLTTDSGFLYWTDYNAGTVNKVALNAASLPASPTSIASGESLPAAPFVTSSGIYWLQTGASGALRYSPFASPSASSVSTGPLASPGTVVVDANYAWVLASGTGPNYADGRIYKIPAGGGAPIIVAQGLYQPNSITMDATHIYWCNNSTTQSGGTRNSDGTINMIVK